MRTIKISRTKKYSVLVIIFTLACLESIFTLKAIAGENFGKSLLYNQYLNWRLTRRADTIEAYKDYLRRDYRSPFVEDAKKRLKEIQNDRKTMTASQTPGNEDAKKPKEKRLDKEESATSTKIFSPKDADKPITRGGGTAPKTPDEGQTDEPFEIKGKYYALVIGINKYKHLHKLKTAVDDAKDVAEMLRKSYGFEKPIRLLDNDATRSRILKKMTALRKKLLEDDKLLIYYAGHGYFDKIAERAYWQPVNAEGDDTTNWIISETITSEIKRIAAKHILIVSDSCYSGVLTREADIDLGSYGTRNNYLKKLQKKNARVLIASGGNEPVADSGGGKHSVFASAFLNALTEIEETVFTSNELFVNHIKEIVAGNSDQTPESNLIRNSGHKGGDFLFRKKTK